MGMDNRTAAERLGDLAQWDIDAVRAYWQAIKEIPDAAIHDTLIRFQGDHQRHITELSQAILGLGATPPTPSPDLKGFFLEQFTSIRSQSGTEGALKAMAASEKLLLKKYNNARGWNVNPGLHAIVEKGYADEHRHLAYIETALRSRPWEHPDVRLSQQTGSKQPPGKYT